MRDRWYCTRVILIAILAFITSLTQMPTRAAAAEPSINAGSAIVLDPDTKLALYERSSHERIAPASLTKVMTALVALEEGDPAQQITIIQSDLIGEASMGLRVGERVSLETLLYGLLLPSGNDAAMAIARGIGARSGDRSGAESVARFVGWMNDAAVRLELTDTHFANPHGLDANGHYSSAFDLARLTGFTWQNPTFAKIFGSATYQGEGHVLRHGNRLIGQYDGVVGGKTGLTDGCGFCLITAAEHGGHRLVVVVLRDSTAGAFADTSTLLGWSYAQIDAGGAPKQQASAPGVPVAPAPVPAVKQASAAPAQANPGAIVATVQAGQPVSGSGKVSAPAFLSFDQFNANQFAMAATVAIILVLVLWAYRHRHPDAESAILHGD